MKPVRSIMRRVEGECRAWDPENRYRHQVRAQETHSVQFPRECERCRQTIEKVRFSERHPPHCQRDFAARPTVQRARTYSLRARCSTPLKSGTA